MFSGSTVRLLCLLSRTVMSLMTLGPREVSLVKVMVKLSTITYHRFGDIPSIKGVATVILPRIPLQSPDNDAWCPFSFKRIQFPVRLAFAMTINKSQGQTLKERSALALRRFSATDNYTLPLPGLPVAIAWLWQSLITLKSPGSSKTLSGGALEDR